jgi:cytochrome c oxidase subunit 2
MFKLISKLYYYYLTFYIYYNDLLLFSNSYSTYSNDAPYPWQIAFQDPASPGFVGIFDLHDNIFFYLVLILIAVMWVLGAVLVVFKSSSNAIASKYLSHGTLIEVIWTVSPFY